MKIATNLLACVCFFSSDSFGTFLAIGISRMALTRPRFHAAY